MSKPSNPRFLMRSMDEAANLCLPAAVEAGAAKFEE